MSITRELFLFACYTGTVYADVVSITRENLSTDEENNLWLKYRRKKTDYLGRIKLLPEALALIEKPACPSFHRRTIIHSGPI